MTIFIINKITFISVEHENLSLKFELKGNLTIFLKYIIKILDGLDELRVPSTSYTSCDFGDQFVKIEFESHLTELKQRSSSFI